MDIKRNYFTNFSKLQRFISQEASDIQQPIPSEQNIPMKTPQEETLNKLCKELRELQRLQSNGIDKRKLHAFRAQARKALCIAKALCLDVHVQTHETTASIKFTSDALLINEACNPNIRIQFLNILRYSNEIWLTTVEKNGENAFCICLSYDLLKT